MDAAVERAVNAGQSASPPMFASTALAALQADIGPADSDELLSQLATLLRGHFSGDSQLARFADDVFTRCSPASLRSRPNPNCASC